MFNHGNAEGKGLAGAGGGLGNHILPLHEWGDGLCLNGGGITVALLLQGFQHSLAEAKAFKRCFHSVLPFSIAIGFIVPLMAGFCNCFPEGIFKNWLQAVDKPGKVWYIVGYENMSAAKCKQVRMKGNAADYG